MKFWIGVALATACIALLDKCASAAECLGSAHKVWAEHPHAHATWHYIDHQKCWRAVDPSAHVSRDRRTPPQANVPVPPLPPLRYDRLLPAEGRALARELLP